jgi:hypothetical protein
MSRREGESTVSALTGVSGIARPVSDVVVSVKPGRVADRGRFTLGLHGIVPDWQLISGTDEQVQFLALVASTKAEVEGTDPRDRAGSDRSA